MAAANIKQEGPCSSPGPTKMPGPSTCDGLVKSSGEHSFSALQGLIMAEDRRTKEKEMNLQNVRFLKKILFPVED